MYRTFVILRHTFLETVVQPIYTLLITVGIGILAIFGMLPFFTLGEDTVMFKSVGLDVILLLVLIATLFATSKSIFEEIEDRTMLTLMSKPVRRWEVLVGKYLGIVTAAAVAIAILGLILFLCVWWRIPGDYQMRPTRWTSATCSSCSRCAGCT
jgi:ABC-type transport system involved in multi-copper enzyme maturation permease subunit